MSTVTVGRTLDSEGNPIEGTGFEVDPDGDLARRIANRTGPVSSHPTRAVWGVPQPGPENVVRTLSIFGPGYTGPPEHYHRQSLEVFDVEAGSLTMTLDGAETQVSAGESATVETGVVHTFRNETDERAIVTTEIHDPGKLRQVLPTLGGLAHDAEGDPSDPLQLAMIAHRLDDNTVFTDGEGPVRGRVVDALTPVARLAGYRGAYDRYVRPTFWERHVEQPALTESG
jgi:mannose-6-phosphate isomerase-like protein (cupin superfamily)